MIVIDTSSDARMVNTTAAGIERMNLPGVPGSISTGRKANTSVAVVPMTATRIDWWP